MCCAASAQKQRNDSPPAPAHKAPVEHEAFASSSSPTTRAPCADGGAGRGHTAMAAVRQTLAQPPRAVRVRADGGWAARPTCRRSSNIMAAAPSSHALPASILGKVTWPSTGIQVPQLRLSSGHLMPMLSIGTGGVPKKQSGRRRLKRAPTPGSVKGLVNSSLHLGFRAIDAAEVYLLFDEVGEAMQRFGH